MPFDPLFIINVAAFPLTEVFAVNDTASILHDRRNHNVQAFMVDDAKNRIQRTILKIVTAADADEIYLFPGQRIRALRMKTQTADAVAPRNASL